MTREERSALGKLKSSDDVFRIQDKGSRFVIISQNEYQDKMLGQLNNDLHYNKPNHDPTIEHFEKVKNWGRKWFSEGQISQESATWVANVEPKPWVAFGNVKTHKEGNPLHLITSCCGMAIERLSSFTEFYLKVARSSRLLFLRAPLGVLLLLALSGSKGLVLGFWYAVCLHEGRLYFFGLVLYLPHCLFSYCICLSQSRVLVFIFYFSSLVNCFHSVVRSG